jgi:hypothetical protein
MCETGLLREKKLYKRKKAYSMSELKLYPQSPGVFPYKPHSCLPDSFEALRVLAITDRLFPQEITTAKLNCARALERFQLNKKSLENIPLDNWDPNWATWQLDLLQMIDKYKEFFLLLRQTGDAFFLESEVNDGFGLIPPPSNEPNKTEVTIIMDADEQPPA